MSESTDLLLLHDYAERAYLDYALMTVKARALPGMPDGQKPVQRRILFAMHEMGLFSTSKPVKSARVVGDVLGKYHPHGDTAAYDAAVRMAQDFTLRYPLIIGQGNFGSRDGDMAAAMRYTEARLSSIAELLLSEIHSETVDWVENYDGSFMEPTVLPARLPFLLLNGASGIAVGMATEIPPHNLREVAEAAIAMVEEPSTTARDILRVMPGPDFPDGAQVISSAAEIEDIYTTGRGSLRVRGQWVREDLARGQWQIAVTSLPYQISGKKIVEEVDALVNPQIKKGKKSLDARQLQLKQMALDLFDTCRDESGKEAAIRVVFEPKTSKVDPEQLMAFLLANTSIESNFAVNLTALSLDGRPRTVGVDVLLREWTTFRLETVRRRSRFELNAKLRRIHILEGRLHVYLNLDKVIRIIREADDPKAELRSQLSLSAEQAEDILEMRLRQLNKLEGIKIERELSDLRPERDRLESLLESEPALRRLIVKEIRADAAKHGDDRRTLIKPEERAAVANSAVLAGPAESVTVVLSRNLWLKAYKGHGLTAEALAFKQGDGLLFKVEASSLDQVYLLDTTGRAYSIKGSDAPTGRGDGVPLSALMDMPTGARVAAMLVGGDEDRVLFAGNRGYGFVAPLKSLASRQRAGKTFLKMADDELPVTPVRLPSEDTGFVICGSSDGRMLAFPLSEAKTYANGGAQGVILMTLGEGIRLSGLLHATGSPFEVQARTKEKVIAVKLTGEDWNRHVGKRARKGVQLPKKAVLET
ncbi:DNA topoisomerase IV subunit A [Burkholderia cenocepacia]|uniref:DNA topoisomerase IV subunit A n=1 Tax=Burkholderia cenocepacia TaxID=95486 RepID=UPI000B1D00B6|nr:DNA topoisomerase IV subunit A [Burkholderia cenocepacia]